MKVKVLIAALQGFDGELEVVVRTPFEVDDGCGWHHTEYDDIAVKSVEQDTSDPDNWISPSNRQVIVISI